MQVSEVLLRLGSSLVAWMMLYAHLLWLAALHAMGCGPDGDEMHRLLLGLAPFTCGFAFAIRLTRPFEDIHKILRWLGVPLMLLMPFAFRSTWEVFQQVNLKSLAICAQGPATGWQSLWPAIQCITVLLVAYMVVNVWRSVMIDSKNQQNSQNKA